MEIWEVFLFSFFSVIYGYCRSRDGSLKMEPLHFKGGKAARENRASSDDCLLTVGVTVV